MRIEMHRSGPGFVMEATNVAGNTVMMDNPSEAALQQGASPMELILMGVAGCSSIDIISILQKQKLRIDNLRVVVEAERDRSQTPAHFCDFEVVYHLDGELDENKVRHAVEMSLERYCTVAKMVEKTVPIKYSIVLNGEEV